MSHAKLEPEFRRISLKEKEEHEAQFGNALAKRGLPGVEGKVVAIRTNFYEVSLLPSGDIIHYDVRISPQAPSRLNRLIMDTLEKRYRQSEFEGIFLAYDGSASAYASKPLPNNAYALDISLAENDKDEGGKPSRQPRVFHVKIKRVASINMELLKLFLNGKGNFTTYEAIQALEVVLRSASCKSNMINVNRSFYSSKNAARLSGPLDAWLGFFFSLRPSAGRLLLNMDTSASCFYRSGSVVELAQSMSGGGRPLATMNEHERNMFERTVRGLKIQVTHRGNQRRKYKVVGLSKNGADKTFFELENGKQLSVAEYFERQYHLRLRYPSLPCVRVGPPDKSVFLPMECCDIVPAQRYLKKLNEQQTADMIKVTCQRPQNKMDSILSGPMELQLAQNPILDAFSIKISKDLLKVDSRILKAPKVFYAKECRQPEIVPEDGAWNLRDKKVFKGVVIEDWAVLNLSRCRSDEVEGFVKELVMSGRDTGLEFRLTNPRIFHSSSDVGGIERELTKAYQGSGRSSGIAQFVLVILPVKSTQIYGEVKRVSDCLIGRPSQCMISKHIARPNRQYISNIAIKINVKLGGINSSLGNQLPFVVDVPTIVFGADVTHPSPGDASRRSIAAVVASMDPFMSRYASIVKVQDSRQEMIGELQEIVKRHLISFNQINRNAKPARILFYRDGLSEGQFSHALNMEVTAIRNACRELEANYNPKITFVIVQKRHHVRFFPTDRNFSDRSGNAPPGTVVDTTITSPIYRDFFLQSHSGIQGTSRPAHYHVIIDENNLSADDIQSLTYRLCYTYARCTRSVSIVPPAYYAHLAAFRSRFHFKSDDSLSSASGGSSEMSGVFLGVRPELERQMYYA